MNVALLPHNDDELFCGTLAMQNECLAIVVLRSYLQEQRGLGITAQQREAETGQAMRELGLTFSQWHYSDAEPDWDAVRAGMRVAEDLYAPEVVLAPAVELGGHVDHNRVGDLADEVFGGRVTHYAMYRRGYGRTVTDQPVVGSADQICRKLRALACYRSQIGEPSTQPWFLDGLTEYLT